MESRSLPVTLRPNPSRAIPVALICAGVCVFILFTWSNGSALTSLIGLSLFGVIPIQTIAAFAYRDEIFLRLDETGFTISKPGYRETIEWNWVEHFLIVKGTKSRRWVGWRYASHYPPPKRRRRSTRYLIADEVLPSHYGTSPQQLLERLNRLHDAFCSTEPQTTILRPQLTQMLSDAERLPMTLYPNKRSLFSMLVVLAVIAAGIYYWLSSNPIVMTVILSVLVLVAVRIIREMNEGKAYLRLEEDGFTHRTTETEQFVRWDEVECFVAGDFSEFVGWRYLPVSADKRKKIPAFQQEKIDDTLMRVYGDRPEDIADLLNRVLAAQKHKLAQR